jgi:hypothetical protein
MKNIYLKSRFSLLLLTIVLGSSSNIFGHSVLSQGHWYKLAVEKTGVYQLTYEDFIAMGFEASSINPNKIQIFGNVEGVLPEANNILVPDSLIENSIYVSGAEDNSFDPGDYVVFYGKSSSTWVYERLLERFRYQPNPYDDQNYYFVTVGEENGKRIGNETSLNDTPFKEVNSFNDYQVHEENLVNFVKSGRKWFGESFDENDHINLSFNFPNRILDKKVVFGLYAAGRASVNSKIFTTANGENDFELYIPKVQGSYIYAKEAEKRYFFYSDESEINLDFTYSKPTGSSNAWIDYVEVNAIRELKMTGHQMLFNYDVLLDVNKIFRFHLQNANSDIRIWNLSDPYNIKEINGTSMVGQTMDFSLLLERTHYFVAFDSQEFLRPNFVNEIANQDLKGLDAFDMAIVTVDEFKGQAERIANFHRQLDHIKVVVVTTDEIYHEFSSGKQDPTAIRNFLRYHYLKNEEDQRPQYLLLFGDASYDYKDVLPQNTNIVPVYQSIGSTSLTATYNTDDYYGIMNQEDGDSALGEIQISIGRFPVHTLEDATTMTDKTIHYASNLAQQMGNWRNRVCFIADDEDSNLHFRDSNTQADTFLIDHPEFNVSKVFLDSYVQQTTPNGKRYPDVNKAINDAVNDGVLFVNYTGHGGHIALADEHILEIPDILSWRNYDKLSVFIVASCEFGPFDNPAHVSAGEHVVLNPLGGGVALFTTTRLAYASYNFKLNKKFHEIAFSRREDGSHYRLGEIIKYAKNESDNKEKNLNFCLLGDPALKMAYPEYYVETTKMNGHAISSEIQDTIKARQTVHVEGQISGLTHELAGDFNGDVDVTVYGKPSVYTTLANDPKSYKANFTMVDKIIYQGTAKVTDGLFDFSFIVPTNISPSYGPGKISYYATKSIGDSTYMDANGGYLDYTIGGVDESIEDDMQGPDISMYLDHSYFKNGDPTTNSPVLFIDLFDENGINNIQLGLGKEIIAKLDHATSYYLNEYYQAEEDSFQKGHIQMQMNKLNYGSHELTVKAWDMFDNASEKSIQFIVVSPKELNVFDVINQPNPFSNITEFTFKHNQTDQSTLTVRIDLYDMQGKSVWSHEQEALVLGNTIQPIVWDVNNSPISNIKTGVYTYVLEITNNEGQRVQQKQKLIVVK